MKIESLFKKLSYSKFSNLHIGVEGSGTIQEEKKPVVLEHANEALLRLHSRFMLREKQVMVEQIPHITHYHLLEKFAKSRAPIVGVPYPYILDTEGEPFIADVIKVHAVYDNICGALFLNDEEQPDSVFTPQPNVLQIPYPKQGIVTSIIYQAKHPELSLDTLGMEIELPIVLEDAFLSYIASSIYSNMNTQEATAKSLEHRQQYEIICQEVIDRDMVNSSISVTNTRFQKRGWI